MSGPFGMRAARQDIKDLLSTKSYTTPEKFGAKGDGIANDSPAIQLAHNTGLPVVYSKTYNMASGVIVNDKPFVAFGGGTIVCNSDMGANYLFTLNRNQKFIAAFVDFNLNRKCQNIFNMQHIYNPRVHGCSFKDSSSLPTTTGQHCVFRAAYSPYASVVGNHFERIGDVGGGSMEVSGHYRCVALNSGCGKHVISDNTFDDCFAPSNVADYPFWQPSKSYAVNAKVVFYAGASTIMDGQQWGLYTCKVAHVSGAIDPLDSSKWHLSAFPYHPNNMGKFNDNVCRNIWDNAVYVNGLGASEAYTANGNDFINCRDEPIVIAGGSANISGGSFHNIKNKCIALDNRYSDLGVINISGVTFNNDSADAIGSFVSVRATGQQYKINSLSITSCSMTSKPSLGAGSHITLDKVGSLTMTGLTINTQAQAYEKVVRVYGTVDSGLVAVNNITTASPQAEPFRFEQGAGSVVRQLNVHNGALMP